MLVLLISISLELEASVQWGTSVHKVAARFIHVTLDIMQLWKECQLVMCVLQVGKLSALPLSLYD